MSQIDDIERLKAIRDMAVLTAAFYNELIAKGIPDHKAGPITAAWVRAAVGQGGGEDA